ncbi:hypothetical protein EAL2_808p02010 (plasmid) [Peptoclostridium acidaminophilum DSM 3953]|uniref:Uncharacterized protein n=1 Tax=Peptoclostridium acidaminophilum DSM 3953 TaxID=1286171 RepID=W8UA81_PEPAC|nr:hypothetical protein EAL2_808p02010 [Peptoclostridium acidaminophilum DSM 3953]
MSCKGVAMGVNYRKCPKCGSKNSLKIIYRKPSYSFLLNDERVKFGGCSFILDSPEYFYED